jgi:hypothetical protein
VDQHDERRAHVLDRQAVPGGVGLDGGDLQRVDDGRDGGVDEPLVERGVLGPAQVGPQRVGGGGLGAEQGDHVPERAFDVADGAGVVPRADGGDERLDAAGEDRVEQVLGRREVVVDEAAGDARSPGDVAHRGPAQAALRVGALGRVEQLRAPSLGLEDGAG